MRMHRTGNYQSYFLFLILALLFIQASQPEQPQKRRRIDIENADLYTFDEKIIKNAQRLIGNVQFRHNEALMFCDSAYSYNDSNMFDAFGNVHIVQGDTLHLYGNKMFYNGDLRIARFVGNVKLIDKSITLTTDELEFDLASNIGYYEKKGKIVDTANVLTSIIGRYYSNDNMFFFKDSVVLTNKDFILHSDTLKYNSQTERAFIVGPTTIVGAKDDGIIYSESGWYDTRTNIAELYKGSKIMNKEQILEGDTLFYDRASGNGRARHLVVLTDTTNKVTVTGRYGIYNEKTKIAFVTDSALFIQYSKKDTLYMHADTLKTIPDTSSVEGRDDKFFMAYHHVRFFKPDLQGQCDSLSYQMKDSVMRMYHDPVLWDQTSQMTGEKIEYMSKTIDPDFAKLENSAFIITKEDSIKFNQISGKTIIGQIFENKLKTIDVNGNAQTLYYLKEGDRYSGMNRLESSKIKVHLVESKIDSITFYPKPEGKTIPLKDLTPENTELRGFLWRDTEKPLNRFDLNPIDEKRKKNAGLKEKPADKKVID
jgi:lipopolysaccharide export system protein LptA